MRQVHVLCIRLIANCVLVLAGIEPVCAQQLSQAIDRIFSELTVPGSPGGAVGVCRDGKIVFAKGYGLANVAENVPITQTVFDVGSVSKQFTAASIVLLEKLGKLRLDDDVLNYIPELPDT
jgi:CubicO group peptidase (beta-lactamase class C family)